MTEFLQQMLNGVSLGSTYALLALGLAMVFTIFGLVNFAHGELITLSAYAMLGAHYLGWPWVAQVVVALVAGIAAAVAMEQLAFRPVRKADPTTMLITSFGLSIAIQAILTMVVSARTRTVPQPDWFGTAFHLGEFTLPHHQLLTVVVTAVALVVLVVVLRRTTAGLAIRAAAEDFTAARLLGVRANWVISSAFATSGLLAGIAAVLILARTGGTVQPTMGLTPVLKAFVAIVIGGVGSLGGAVMGGFVLGIIEVSLRAWLPSSMTGFTDGLLFALVAAVVLLRPQGILGKVERLRT